MLKECGDVKSKKVIPKMRERRYSLRGQGTTIIYSKQMIWMIKIIWSNGDSKLIVYHSYICPGEKHSLYASLRSINNNVL